MAYPGFGGRLPSTHGQPLRWTLLPWLLTHARLAVDTPSVALEAVAAERALQVDAVAVLADTRLGALVNIPAVVRGPHLVTQCTARLAALPYRGQM